MPAPPQAVVALASFARDRLSGVSGTLAPLLTRGAQLDVAPLAGLIVGAAAPFAPAAYSRARLIRHLHASGLLTDDEVRRSTIVLEADAGGQDLGDAPGMRRPQ